MRDMHTYSLNSWQLKSRAHILCSPLLSYFHRCTYTYTHIFTVALAPKDKVRWGEGCDGAPMWARMPWTGFGGSGFSYGLIIMSEGVGVGAGVADAAREIVGDVAHFFYYDILSWASFTGFGFELLIAMGAGAAMLYALGVYDDMVL